VSTAVLTGAPLPRKALAVLRQHMPPVLTEQQHSLLRSAMDEIIPGEDSMPGASDVGSFEYLAELIAKAPTIKEDMEKSLSLLAELTSKQFGTDFAALSHDKRIALLKAFESKQPEAFNSLKGYVYESYYMQAKIWKLIGYEVHAADQSTSGGKIFDETLLVNVKKMPRLYRDAP
jgi:hypothetical protein